MQMPAKSFDFGREVPQRKHRTYNSKLGMSYLDEGRTEALVRSLSKARQ